MKIGCPAEFVDSIVFGGLLIFLVWDLINFFPYQGILSKTKFFDVAPKRNRFTQRGIEH